MWSPWPRREEAASTNCSVVGSRVPWPSPPPSSLLLLFPTGGTQPGARGKVNLADAVTSLGVLGHRAEWWRAESGSGEHTGVSSTHWAPPPTEVWIYPDKTELGWWRPCYTGGPESTSHQAVGYNQRDFKRKVSPGANESPPAVCPRERRTTSLNWKNRNTSLNSVSLGAQIGLLWGPTLTNWAHSGSVLTSQNDDGP